MESHRIDLKKETEEKETCIEKQKHGRKAERLRETRSPAVPRLLPAKQLCTVVLVGESEGEITERCAHENSRKSSLRAKAKDQK